MLSGLQNSALNQSGIQSGIQSGMHSGMSHTGMIHNAGPVNQQMGYSNQVSGLSSAPSQGYLFGMMPTDNEIYMEIERIINSADLMTITKKQVRDELSRRFGVDLSHKKDMINKSIDQILGV
eukprot:NODE_403_length_8041_cov_0.563712.p6 type:complete len:122 gc:universal NODE_403_length_8041_cov_0.563712:1723-2088(+)